VGLRVEEDLGVTDPVDSDPVEIGGDQLVKS
jgi:hypothetical protein